MTGFIYLFRPEETEPVGKWFKHEAKFASFDMITFRAKGNTIDPISEEEAGKQSRRDQSHVCPVSSLECLYHRCCTEDDRCKPHQYDKQIFKVRVIMEHVPIESCREPKQQKGRYQILTNPLKLFHYSARPSSKRAGDYAYNAISRIGLLPEIPLQQALEGFAVTGLVAGHLWGFAPQGERLRRGLLYQSE